MFTEAIDNLDSRINKCICNNEKVPLSWIELLTQLRLAQQLLNDLKAGNINECL